MDKALGQHYIFGSLYIVRYVLTIQERVFQELNVDKASPLCDDYGGHCLYEATFHAQRQRSFFQHDSTRVQLSKHAKSIVPLAVSALFHEGHVHSPCTCIYPAAIAKLVYSKHYSYWSVVCERFLAWAAPLRSIQNLPVTSDLGSPTSTIHLLSIMEVNDVMYCITM